MKQKTRRKTDGVLENNGRQIFTVFTADNPPL